MSTSFNQDHIESLLRGLDSAGFDTASLWSQLAERVKARECRTPGPDDLAWPLVPAVPLDEHLGLVKPLSQKAQGVLDIVDNVERQRPYLSCAIVKGRAYRLSEAQKVVLREWFNMIPSPQVEVLEIATFPGAPTLVREVILRTEEHIDPANKRLLNGPRRVTIDKWGMFMSACKRVEVERVQAAEVSRLTARVTKLLLKAKEAKVAHGITTPGKVAWEWHSVLEAEGTYKVTDADERSRLSRDHLRAVLTSHGEWRLAELVKDPALFAVEGERKVAQDFAAFDALLNEELKK